MQLRLLVVVATGLLTSSASGQLEAASRSGVYLDDDGTRVVTSVVALRADPTPEIRLGAHYLVDVVSSASVDVVSAATPNFEETRQQGGGTVTWDSGDRQLGGGYVFSRENDWRSHAGSLSLSQDFAQHNHTVSVAASYVHNLVGRASDPTFADRLRVFGGQIAWATAASALDLVKVSATVSWLEGYQASPYRFVRFNADGGGAVTLSRPEAHPRVRRRAALTLHWNRQLRNPAALRTHVRAYVDDWGVASGTLGGEYVQELGEAFEVAGVVRGYGQSGARFFEDHYTQPRRYMSADRELSAFFDVFYGTRIAWRRATELFEELHLELEVMGFRFWFQEFERLPSRSGFVAELGLRVRR